MTEQTAASSLPGGTIDVQVKEAIESDDESQRVPEIGGEVGGGREVIAARLHSTSSEATQKRRGRSQVDRENKRLKRLLRNRVSAQQARERKKAYMNDLEVKLKDLEMKNNKLEERLSTLQNENQMLRQILKNTTATNKRGGNDERSTN